MALLGYGLWQRSFGGDPGIVGRSIRLDTRPHTVVGVLPAGFRGLTGTAEIWVPVMTQDAGFLRERWAHSYQMIGRLKPGVTVEQAKSAVTVLGAQVEEAHPDTRPAPGAKPWGAVARTMDEARIDPTRLRSVLVLLGVFGAIALVLSAIGVYGVLSYAVTQRTHEIGIRIALGADPRDVLALVLSRGLALTAAGIVLGVAVALASTRVLTTLLYEVKPSDAPTYIVISGVLGLAALVASYIPARRATRVDPLIALRSE